MVELQNCRMSGRHTRVVRGKRGILAGFREKGKGKGWGNGERGTGNGEECKPTSPAPMASAIPFAARSTILAKPNVPRSRSAHRRQPAHPAHALHRATHLPQQTLAAALAELGHHLFHLHVLLQ